LFTQKYNDFVEVATESISEYSKSVGGTWNREDVDEIVTAQVIFKFMQLIM
jgi:hypothetical protein